MSLLPQELIRKLLDAAVSAGLDRQTLLIAMSPSFVASLPQAHTRKDQLFQDLNTLNGVARLLDGSVPLRQWLETALSLAHPRPEAEVFRQALEALSEKSQGPVVMPSPPKREPVKILFLGTNPSDLTQRALDQEVREIGARLRSAKMGERFKLVQEWAVRVGDLQEALLNHQPTIVHFSGHGNKDGQIAVEDQHGKAFSLNIRALAMMFKTLRDNIQCVVLNSHASEAQAKAISEHIDCVVGMKPTLTDAASITFSGAFYQGLGYGRNIATVFSLGCDQLLLEGFSEADLPVLICREGIRPEEVRLLEPSG